MEPLVAYAYAGQYGNWDNFVRDRSWQTGRYKSIVFVNDIADVEERCVSCCCRCRRYRCRSSSYCCRRCC